MWPGIRLRNVGAAEWYLDWAPVGEMEQRDDSSSRAGGLERQGRGDRCKNMWSDPGYAVATLVVGGFTLGVIWLRIRGLLENNWPLVYYALVVAYMQWFPRALDPNWVYVALVSGLLLRFEFMSGRCAKVVVGIELLALGHIAIQVSSLMLG